MRGNVFPGAEHSPKFELRELRPAAVSQAISAAGHGGEIVMFSVPSPRDTVPLPLFDLYRNWSGWRTRF